MCGHRVAGLVDRHRVAFPFDVLDVFGRPKLLRGTGVPDVFPFHGIAIVANGEDQAFVDQVLHLGSRVIGRHRGQTVDFLVGEDVLHLLQVAAEGLLTADLRGVSHFVDAVDATGPEQRLVEGIRHIGRHHHQDPVLRRRLWLHPDGTP